MNKDKTHSVHVMRLLFVLIATSSEERPRFDSGTIYLYIEVIQKAYPLIKSQTEFFLHFVSKVGK